MLSTILLAAAGAFSWTTHIPEGGLQFAEKNGALSFRLAGRGAAKGGDGYVETALPLYGRGALDFDVRQTPATDNRAMSLFLTFYNITVFWHDACKDWRVFVPGPEAKRERGFRDEPTSHHQMAIFEPGKWHHCRIEFDRSLGRVEFFLDDLTSPVYILGDWSVWGTQEFLGGALRIGGLGLSKNSVWDVKDVVLSERPAASAATARTETIVFEGFANDYYDLRTRLAGRKPRFYTLVTTRASESAANAMRFTGMPGASLLSAAKTIVLEDAPVGPGELIPHFVVEDIVRQVKEGATLVVLDGFFSLKRGKYDESALKEIIPARTLPKTGFGAFPSNPEIVVSKVGRGEVRVFRGLRFTEEEKDFVSQFDPWFDRLFGR